MRILPLLGLLGLLFACTHAQRREPAEHDRAAVTFHVLGLQKTPSGAT